MADAGALLPLTTAAGLLGVGPNTLRGWVRAGIGPPHVRQKNRYYFPADTLHNHLVEPAAPRAIDDAAWSAVYPVLAAGRASPLREAEDRRCFNAALRSARTGLSLPDRDCEGRVQLWAEDGRLLKAVKIYPGNLEIYTSLVIGRSAYRIRLDTPALIAQLYGHNA